MELVILYKVLNYRKPAQSAGFLLREKDANYFNPGSGGDNMIGLD